MDTLTDLVFQGLSYPNHNIMNNLILKTIREYIRLAHAYLLAYDRGLDIVAADEWIKWRRSHGGYCGQMDAGMEILYFSCRRLAAEEEAEVDYIEKYSDAIEAILMLGVRSESAADEEMIDASADYIYGDEDGDVENDVVNDDVIDVDETSENA